jgi:hypothetical protein
MALKDHQNAAIVQAVRDWDGTPPLNSSQNACLWTEIAVYARHMDANPKRYTDTTVENAPPGSRIILGHSIEDWSRALVAYRAYYKLRTRSSYKHGSAKPSPDSEADKSVKLRFIRAVETGTA